MLIPCLILLTLTSESDKKFIFFKLSGAYSKNSVVKTNKQLYDHMYIYHVLNIPFLLFAILTSTLIILPFSIPIGENGGVNALYLVISLILDLSAYSKRQSCSL